MFVLQASVTHGLGDSEMVPCRGPLQNQNLLTPQSSFAARGAFCLLFPSGWTQDPKHLAHSKHFDVGTLFLVEVAS